LGQLSQPGREEQEVSAIKAQSEEGKQTGDCQPKERNAGGAQGKAKREAGRAKGGQMGTSVGDDSRVDEWDHNAQRLPRRGQAKHEDGATQALDDRIVR